MKRIFPGYFPLKRGELKHLWEQAFFVLDANILLNFYRYSDETRDEFLKILKLLGDRLWIPHRAAFEFLENRLEVIGQQEKAYEEALKSISDIEGALKNTRQHPFISVKLMAKMTEVFAETKKELEKSKADLSTRISADPVLEKIEELLSGKVGECFDAEGVKQLCVEGEARYKKRIPPGYKDAAKGDESDNERKFGDLIIWKQILHKAASTKTPVILLLDDRKEDWWQKFRGKTIGPRPELTKEFYDSIGKGFHMYQPDQFLEHAAEHLKEKVNSAAVKELRERRKIHDTERTVYPRIISRRYAEWRAMRNSYMQTRDRLGMVEARIRKCEEQIALKKAEANFIEPTSPDATRAYAEYELLQKESYQLRTEQEVLMRQYEELSKHIAQFREYAPKPIQPEIAPGDITDDGPPPLE